MQFNPTPSPPDSGKSGLLINRFGESIIVRHEYQTPIPELIETGRVDSLLIEPEDGFSLLGRARDYVSDILGLKKRHLTNWVLNGMTPDLEPNISSLADWARDTAPNVTILGIPSLDKSSQLKGLILVPYEGSNSYKQYSQPRYSKPYRDFFYNVTYEAMYYAYKTLGARKFAISHLSCTKYLPGGYREDITRSQIDAIIHFCDEYRGVREITFWDDGEGNFPIEALTYMSLEDFRGKHRKIEKSYERRMGVDFISISWIAPTNHNQKISTSTPLTRE